VFTLKGKSAPTLIIFPVYVWWCLCSYFHAGTKYRVMLLGQKLWAWFWYYSRAEQAWWRQVSKVPHIIKWVKLPQNQAYAVVLPA